MKKPIQFLAAAMLMFAAMSCEKTSCSTCSINTDAPGASQSKTYCGTDAEIAKENTRLKNDCETLKLQYPQNTFNCGCN